VSLGPRAQSSCFTHSEREASDPYRSRRTGSKVEWLSP
jgi:hypothetical protein